jgi:FemAB-related protein (PEP-CTERM system-associated)
MNDDNPQFIVFSDDWDRHPSSSQHLFKVISKANKTLWVNTIGLRRPRADFFTLFRGFGKLMQWISVSKKCDDNRLRVISPLMLPTFGGGFIGKLNRKLTAWQIQRAMRRFGMSKPVVFTSLPTAFDFVGAFDERKIIYYLTDDYRFWPGADKDKIHAADMLLTLASDLVLSCSLPLEESHSQILQNIFQVIDFPHAVDFEHFSKTMPEPDIIKSIPHPRICFFGLIYEKIDLDLLCSFAKRNPSIHCMMLGPVSKSIQVKKYPPNIHFPGAVDYNLLPAFLHAMDVLLIPYVKDPEKESASPLKLRECLAAGKPVVALETDETRKYSESIYLYSNANQFETRIKSALSDGNPPGFQNVREKIAHDTWELRAKELMTILVKDKIDFEKDDPVVSISTTPPDGCEVRSEFTGSTIFHDPGWGSAFKTAYSLTPYYVVIRRNSRMTGYLQLIHQKCAVFGNRLVSLPWFDASGFLAKDDKSRMLLVRETIRLMQRLFVDSVELRSSEKLTLPLPMRTDKVSFEVNLSPDAESLWSKLDSKVRNQIRKGQSAEYKCFEGSGELLDDFYRVYSLNMRNLGSPPHSKYFFESILKSFSDYSSIYCLRKENRTVAAGFVIKNNKSVFLPWASSDWREKKNSPNMLLYWSIIEACCKKGAETFDMGRCTVGSGSYHFKKQWPAKEKNLFWYYLLTPRERLPQIDPASSRYKIMIALWKKLPLWVSEKLGPLIISRLS